jgi:hypothetical protein
MYCVDPKGFVYFKADINNNYKDKDEGVGEGLLTLNEYRYVHSMLAKGYVFDIYGRPSIESGDKDDLTFYIEDKVVEEQIREKGFSTNIEYFANCWKHCESCRFDDDDDYDYKNHPHRYNKNKDYPVTNEEFYTDDDNFNVDDIISDGINKERTKTKTKIEPKKVALNTKKTVPKKKIIPKKKIVSNDDSDSDSD